MKRFYSNGKLLITGEYVVLDGATALAVPTKRGQDLTVESIQESQLIWASFTSSGDCWFEAIFDLPKLRLVQATFNSSEEGSHEQIAETLLNLLQEAKNLNPEFLTTDGGYIVKTHLTFPRDWGLGSSSTLINNIAQWAEVDPFKLLWNAFSGSGYDIACAANDVPVFYQLKNNQPKVDRVDFAPSFRDHLYFIYLNQKQNSREGIKQYRQFKGEKSAVVDRISEISIQLSRVSKLDNFERLVEEHESLISSVIGIQPVKQRLFPDFNGVIKSLGAWGGDFILATGDDSTLEYFKQKGYSTIISYSDMVL